MATGSCRVKGYGRENGDEPSRRSCSAMNDGCSTTLGDNCVMRFTAGGRSRREDRRQANSGYQNQQSDKISLREFHQSWHVLSLSKEFCGSETSASETSQRAGHRSSLAVTVILARPSVRRAGVHQKKTPLCSVPNCAKLVRVVAGSDSKWKPRPVSFGVVAETAIVAEHSKKSPRNLFVASLNGTLRVTPLHSIFIELMMALKIPSACVGSKLLGTVKASNTQTLCTSNSAVPPAMSTLPLPAGYRVPPKTREPAATPGAYECKPNGLPFRVSGGTPKLSKHMEPMEPRC